MSIMKIKNIFIVGAAIISAFAANAGNEDRVGSAGASHLLVNPWARSSAFGDAGVAAFTAAVVGFSQVR